MDGESKPELFRRRTDSPSIFDEEVSDLEKQYKRMGDDDYNKALITIQLLHDLRAALKSRRRVEEVDKKTDLYNGDGFYAQLSSRSDNFQPDKPFSVLLIDLNKFKQINEDMGHLKGDEALVETAAVLQVSTRPGDYVARIQGDEFGIILDDTNEEEANIVKARIKDNLQKVKDSKSEFSSNIVHRINMDIGVVEWKQGMTKEVFMEDLDKMMFEDKRKE